ncbi:MAG: ParB/RepB/Spo0J family partition protein, partial [Lachnospiraceae bacterium]|nr:ParB/RepB/Spo0J family partition protein [Lachnospiraceae bacterium]
MRRPQKEIQLTSYDDLLGIAETDNPDVDRVLEMPLTDLYSPENHPFQVRDDEKMVETVESIQKYGVLNPALVRPRAGGGYELISGNRRKRDCELAEKDTMPVLVRNYTDDEAVIVMVDSNIQRENILPSEKA